MSIRNITSAIAVILLLTLGVMGGFVYWALPRMESPAVAGLVGVIVGAFVGMFGTSLNAIVAAWNTSKEAAESLKDRISNHALQLTQMDYDLRLKSLAHTQQSKQFLAPAKVYRTFYKALLDLHTTGNWPKEVEDLGLLNIFTLGSTTRPNQQVE